MKSERRTAMPVLGSREMTVGRELKDAEPEHYFAWLRAWLGVDDGSTLPVEELEALHLDRHHTSVLVAYYEFRLLGRDPFGLRAKLPAPLPLFESDSGSA